MVYANRVAFPYAIDLAIVYVRVTYAARPQFDENFVVSRWGDSDVIYSQLLSDLVQSRGLHQSQN
jgi:hypothetical protein